LAFNAVCCFEALWIAQIIAIAAAARTLLLLYG
jgi:hypothetical protein